MRKPTEIERTIHRFFAVGLSVSAALILIGLFRVLGGRAERPDVTPQFGSILRLSLHGDPLAWVYLGILALMLMPVFRVVVASIAFARLREWRFAAAGVAVLVLLLISVALGMR